MTDPDIAIFTGGRKYDDDLKVKSILQSLPRDCVIYVGDAPGLDALVRAIAASRNMNVEVFAADWDYYGPCAGPIRNYEMVSRAMSVAYEWVVHGYVFEGGRGTENCYKIMKRLGVHKVHRERSR